MLVETSPDAELLRLFVDKPQGAARAQEAFALLQRRHARLVYSVCLRELGNPTEAEDAAQATFLLLAQRAHRLRRAQSLPSWLFSTARLVASNARRQRLRHIQKQEKIQREMPQTTDDLSQRNRQWEELEPYLHAAMASLKTGDRGAILLRFFAGLSLAELGERLEISEAAAQMRVARAMERLRENLRKRGVVIPALLLTSLLEERAAEAAPMSLLAPSSAAASSSAVALSSITQQALQRLVWLRLTGISGALLVSAFTYHFLAPFSWPLGRYVPDRVLLAKLAAANQGHWQGTMTWRNFTDERQESQPVTIQLTHSPNGAALELTADFPGERFDTRTPIRIDARNHWYQEGIDLGGYGSWQNGRFVVTGQLREEGSDLPAAFRLTWTHTGDTLIRTLETGTPLRMRNRFEVTPIRN